MIMIIWTEITRLIAAAVQFTAAHHCTSGANLANWKALIIENRQEWKYQKNLRWDPFLTPEFCASGD